MKERGRRSSRDGVEPQQALLGTQPQGQGPGRRHPQQQQGPSPPGSGDEGGEPMLCVYKKRWILLTLLFLLTAVSNWVCFGIAAIDTAATAAYPTLPLSTLVALFLGSNVIGCLWEPYLLHRVGLRGCVTNAALVMAVGTFVRSGVPGWFGADSDWQFYVAFVLVGLSQPVFQITALVLAQDWFPTTERSLVTAILLNSNYFGIGVAYVAGNLMVGDTTDGIPLYFQVQTYTSITLLVLSLLLFQSRPPLPPSRSAAAKLRRPTPSRPLTDHWLGALGLLRDRNFALTALAFCVSAAASNVIAAEFSYLVADENGDNGTLGVAAVAACFEGFMVLGSTLVGWTVTRTHAYHTSTLVLLALSAVAAIASASCLAAGNFVGFWCTLMLLGVSSGPLLPLQADLGVEVVYPRDENDVLFVDMVAANTTSTAAVYICYALRNATEVPFLSSLYGLGTAAAIALALFAALFKGQYNRLKFDAAGSASAAFRVASNRRLSIT